MKNQYNVIVIGSGPGGEGAAMKATKEGRKVAVIDDKPDVGGNCTHRATIPSKALRHAIQAQPIPSPRAVFFDVPTGIPSAELCWR